MKMKFYINFISKRTVWEALYVRHGGVSISCRHWLFTLRTKKPKLGQFTTTWYDTNISYFQVHNMHMYIFFFVEKARWLSSKASKHDKSHPRRLHNFNAERANCWMGSRRCCDHLEEGLSLLNNNASSVTALSKVIVVKAKREPSNSIIHRMIHDTAVAQNRLIIVEINPIQRSTAICMYASYNICVRMKFERKG